MAATGVTLWVILSLPAHDTKLTGNKHSTTGLYFNGGLWFSACLPTIDSIPAFVVKFYLGIAVFFTVQAEILCSVKRNAVQISRQMTQCQTCTSPLLSFTLLKSQSLLFQLSGDSVSLGNGHLPSEPTIF